LREDPDVAAKALEFTILTAKRTSEVIEMPRGEAAVAIATGVWTIPGERMKRKKGDMREQHDEPLAVRAIEILKERFEALGDQDFVFPGARRGRRLGENAMMQVLKRIKIDSTVHGFRSSFRDWAGNETSLPREVAEHALSHKVGDETERAYRRSDALKKRRELMELWARYMEGDRDANVVAIGDRRG
jgi:integrase